MPPERHTPIPDTLLAAYEAVQDEFPEADVSLGIDVGAVEYLVELALDVELDIEDVDDWQEKRDRVREIAREHEEGDEMFYTHVDRRRDDD